MQPHKRQWKDYYEILEVDPESNQEDIKKAYRKLAIGFHPDKNPNITEQVRKLANEKMKDIIEAYKVLSEPEKRKIYHLEWTAKKNPPPKPVVNPPYIRFIDVPAKSVSMSSFVIRNEGGRYSRITVLDPKSWVRVIRFNSLTDSDDLPAQVDIEAEGEDWGATYSEIIIVRLDNEETQVRIELRTQTEPAGKTTYASPIPQTPPTSVWTSPAQPSPPIQAGPRPKMSVLAKWIVSVLFIIVAITVWRSIAYKPNPPQPKPQVSYSTPQQTAPPPELALGSQGKADGTRIAFISERNGNREIYVMESDGSSQRNLSQYPADEWAPVWSPDGKRLLFQSSRDRWGEYFIMDCDGGNVKKVVDQRELDPSEPPCWDPNGKTILIDSGFSTDEAVRRNEGLYRYDVETATRSKIDDPPEVTTLARYIHLAWSPDGTRIAFRTHDSRSDNRNGLTRIWTMKPNGTDAVPLTNELWVKDGPWWTADCQSLVFTIHEGYEGNKWKGKICVLNVANKAIVEAEPWAPVTDMKPAPNTNSGVVAFTDGWHIYITRFDGRTWSTPNKIDHATNPAWSPDGTKLAFASTGTGRQPQIYIADADGENIMRVTPTVRRETPTDAWHRTSTMGADDISPSSANFAPAWGKASKPG